ncbi:hypothetical protein, partial [Staphylococcus aureus]
MRWPFLTALLAAASLSGVVPALAGAELKTDNDNQKADSTGPIRLINGTARPPAAEDKGQPPEVDEP